MADNKKGISVSGAYDPRNLYSQGGNVVYPTIQPTLDQTISETVRLAREAPGIQNTANNKYLLDQAVNYPGMFPAFMTAENLPFPGPTSTVTTVAAPLVPNSPMAPQGTNTSAGSTAGEGVDTTKGVAAFQLPSATQIQAPTVQMADYQPYYNQFKELYGSVTPEAQARLKEREDRAAKAERENAGDRLIEFGLGMLGQKDFYKGMGESGMNAFRRYGEEKKAARSERDAIADKQLALAMQDQQMRAQALNAGLGQAQAETGVAASNAQLQQAAAIANQNAQMDMAKLNVMLQNATTEAQAKAIDAAAKEINEAHKAAQEEAMAGADNPNQPYTQAMAQQYYEIGLRKRLGDQKYERYKSQGLLTYTIPDDMMGATAPRKTPSLLGL